MVDGVSIPYNEALYMQFNVMREEWVSIWAQERNKSIHRTDSVEFMNSHRATHCIGGCQQLNLHHSVGAIHHYRCCSRTEGASGSD